MQSPTIRSVRHRILYRFAAIRMPVEDAGAIREMIPDYEVEVAIAVDIRRGRGITVPPRPTRDDFPVNEALGVEHG